MSKIILIILAIGLISRPSLSQSFSQQRTNLTLYNIGVGALVGGAGGLLNMKPGEKGINAFLRGFGIGAAGGSLIAIGKSFTHRIVKTKTLEYAWLARITNAAGSSIIQNAYNNREWWAKWNMNAIAFRMEYDVKSNKFKTRILASNLYTSIVFATQAKLNVGRTLRTGVFFYEKDGLPRGFGLEGTGIGVGTSIGIDKNTELNDLNQFYSIVAHEVVHTFQYDNLYWLNPLFHKLDARIKTKSKVYSGLNKYFYLDLNGIALYIIYEIQKNQEWGCRLYEQEAENFSNKLVLPCN